MLKRIKNFISSIISDNNDRNIFAIGSSHFGLASKNYKDIKNINQVEYKVFSQNGEDGIIDFIKSIKYTKSKIFRNRCRKL